MVIPTIERLAPDHVREYRALMLGAYAAHPDAFVASVDERAAEPLSFWEARLDPSPDAREQVLGAFLGTRLVGVAGVSFELRPKRRHRSSLFGMFVEPDARRRGVASQLVDAALHVAGQREGCLVMQVTLLGPNGAARALYERHGFLIHGVEPLGARLGDRYVDKLYMWRLLPGVDPARI